MDFHDLFFLRCWVGFVGFVAIITGVQCYLDQDYTRKRIYTLQPREAGRLFSRMFGNWTLLAGVIRVIFAFSVPSLGLYLITLFSFALAFFHFAVEVNITQSAPVIFATVSPLVIAGTREIQELRIGCTNIYLGCDWTGELRALEEHLTFCPYSLVTCTNKCLTSDGEEYKCLRKDLEEHLKEKCPKRSFKCSHNQEKHVCEELATTHLESYHDIPTKCPSCDKELPSSLLCLHISTDCEYGVVKCKYSSVGCTAEVLRRDLEDHENDDKLHLGVLLKSVAELQGKMQEVELAHAESMAENKLAILELMADLQNQMHKSKQELAESMAELQEQLREAKLVCRESMAELQEQIQEDNTAHEESMTELQERLQEAKLVCRESMAELQEQIQDNNMAHEESMAELQEQIQEDNTAHAESMKGQLASLHSKLWGSKTIKLPKYRYTKASNSAVDLPSFYTSPSGYHICLKVYPNGHGNARGTHISVYVKILKGNNDAQLKWPFIGSIKLTLLNQLKDKGHYTKKFEVGSTDNLQIGSGYLGHQMFIAQSELAYNEFYDTQYLKDDTLFFRMSTKVSHYVSKPWLLV